MAKTRAQKIRAVNQDELRVFLAEKNTVKQIIDNIEKIEELNPTGNDNCQRLNKYKTANEQRIRLLNKYLPDLKETSLTRLICRLLSSSQPMELTRPQSDIFVSPDQPVLSLLAGVSARHSYTAELLHRALRKPDQNVWYVAPTYKAAKEIAWDMLGSQIPHEYVQDKKLSLTIDLKTDRVSRSRGESRQPTRSITRLRCPRRVCRYAQGGVVRGHTS